MKYNLILWHNVRVNTLRASSCSWCIQGHLLSLGGGGGRGLMKIFNTQLKVGLLTLSSIAHKNETM